jgi:hypothetical protein
MNTNSFHPVIRVFFFLGSIVIGLTLALTSAVALEADLQNSYIVGPGFPYDRIVQSVCALILFLTVILFFKLTGVNWILSVLAGLLAILSYFTSLYVAFHILGAFAAMD